MKKPFFLLVLALLLGNSLLAQNCGQTPPSDNKMYDWCYKKDFGTNWDTSPYKAYIINGLPFRLLYPKNYSSSGTNVKYPLVILLHGIGEYGTDNNRQLKYGGRPHLKAVENGHYEGFVMVPQSPSQLWSTPSRNAIVAFVKHAIRELRVDPFRVQLQGYSAGGTATWRLANEHPTVFAAAIPMSSADGGIAGYAENLKYTAVWHAQGGRDASPSPGAGDRVAKSFTNAGANYKYQFYPELGHGTWFAMYREADLFPFLMRNSMLNIHALHYKYNFCGDEAYAGKMGVKQGFQSYEWRRNGQLIPGANQHELPFTEGGSFTVRIKREGVWSEWSKPLTITRLNGGPKPTLVASGPTALPSLDGKTTVTLRTTSKYQSYKWTDGSTLDSLVVREPGSYSASVVQGYECPSDYASPIKVTYNAVGVLPAPAGLVVTSVSETALSLQWQDKSSNETGFEVYRSTSANGPWVLRAQLPANATTLTEQQLRPFTRYHYAIRAVNAEGGSTYLHGNGKTAEDALAPSTPANLEVSSTSRTAVSLKWLASTDNLDSDGTIVYGIYTDDKTTLLGTTTATTFTARGLAEKQLHNFYVRAADRAGNKSGFSNRVTAGTYYNGLQYTYYEGAVSTVYDISLLTPVKTGYVPNFDIKTPRQVNDNFAFVFEGYINIPTAGSYTFYTKSDDGSTLSINGREVVSNNGKHTPEEKSGTIELTAGFHPIKVLYFEATGSTEMLEVYWQGPGLTKALIPDAAFREEFDLPAPPEAPENFTARAKDYQQIVLEWTDKSTSEKGFELLRSTSNSGPFALVKLIAADSTRFTDIGLQPATTYYYKLRALGESSASDYAGMGAEGSWTNATTAAAPAVLAPPTDLTAYRTDSATAQLNWTDQSPNEAGFEVWRGTDGVNFAKVGTTGANVRRFSDQTPDATNNYQYRIRAISASQSSDWSNIAVLSEENKAPVIGGLPQVVSGPENTKTEITFDLYDPEGEPLQLKVQNLPSFAKIVQTQGKKGQLVLTPGVRHIGYYPDIQLTASDGLLETDITFSISIRDNQHSRIFVNIGQQASVQKPWNNIDTTAIVAGKVVLANMLDENGEETGYSLQVVEPWSSLQPYGETSGTNSGVYPDAITRSGFLIEKGKKVQLKLSGLKASHRYNLVFFGSSIFKSNNGSTTYSVGSQQVNLAVQSNIDNTVQLNGIKADGKGEVLITVTGAPDATKGGYLNALVLEQHPDNNQLMRPGRLLAHASAKSRIELRWTDNSYQETAFEVLRRALPSGDFEKIATTPANTTAYSDEELTPNTAFEYKVRAVSGSAAAASYAVQATTLQDQLYINAGWESEADAPWNNLNQSPLSNHSWYNFMNEAKQRTGISLRLEESFDGSNNFGPDAGGKGIYPDKVIKSFYFNEVGSIARMQVYGLNGALTYNFRFFASSAFGEENGVSEYRIGAQKVTLDVQNNLSNTAVIRNVRPRNGSVMIEVEAGPYARYGYLNGLVVEARDAYLETTDLDPNNYFEKEEEEIVGEDEKIVDPKEKALTIYPNPAHNSVHVVFEADAESRCYIQVLDLLGRAIHTQQVQAQKGKNTFVLDLSSLSVSKGMYLVKVSSDDFKSKAVRMIKQ